MAAKAACTQNIKQKLVSSWDSVHWLGEQASNTKINWELVQRTPKKETEQKSTAAEMVYSPTTRIFTNQIVDQHRGNASFSRIRLSSPLVQISRIRNDEKKISYRLVVTWTAPTHRKTRKSGEWTLLLSATGARQVQNGSLDSVHRSAETELWAS